MSGNSGAEQLNIRLSVPVQNEEVVGKDIIPDIIDNEELIKEAEQVLDKIEDAVLDAKDTLFKVEFEKESFDEPEIEKIEENVDSDILVEENVDEAIENSSQYNDCKEIITKDNFVNNQSETISVEEPKIKELTVVETTPEIKVDINEVIGGFEVARKVIKGLYKTVFNSSFNPSENDVVADLLAYIGAKAEEYQKAEEYLTAFGVETSRFANRYREKSYIPLCFKISVWADKNKNLNETIELLNGVLRALFAFNVSESEVKTVEKVRSSITSIIEYLNAQGVDSGF